ncbi:glycosyltransferase family 4 protein [Streptococcus suis]|uniref:glycosyltransferase family 4 protein n=1 Tax=Streptococcus suis TaxID=1307 RepID=UPI001ABE3677|nr:glycosyltransferase family 4 protein [Streptococcus suis]
MKILFVSPVGALFSGAEVAIVNLMTYLAQNGYQVFNVIPDNETNTDHKYLQMMEEAGIQLYALKTMKWWWFESSPSNPAEKDAILAYQHKNIVEVREIIRSEKIDLVISNTANVFQGAIAAACEGCLHYYIIHEFPYGEFGYYYEKLELINSLSDKIFAVEGGLYNELGNYFPENKLHSFVPYSKIDNQQLREAKKKRIISIGGITERKNQLELIKAIHSLNNPNLELLLIGGWDEDYKVKCDCYIEQHGLQNITFLGYQENPWQFITNKDIAVFSSSLETYGLVLVEAIVNSVPIIISDNPGHLSVKDSFNIGEVYRLGNIESLREKLEIFLKNFDVIKTEAERKSLEAREFYTIEKASKSIIESIDFYEVSPKISKLNPFKNFFDLSLDNSVLEGIKNQKITIFYGDDQGNFSESDSSILPLEELGEISFDTMQFSRLRIDLSENPIVFSEVKLTSKRTGTELQPIYTNALVKDKTLIFYKKDPQLVYDISTCQQDCLKLTYRRNDQDSLGEILYTLLEQETIQKNQLESAKEELNSYIQSLQNRLDTLQAEYSDLFKTYNSVIHSRRWTIPTKIFNFFRRKK